ncbi:MAG: hypothetical protein HZA54_06795, partial [Planctomycetes bacterium]|nr:hypothetical protein [Planctomycetota bacterium]
MPAPQDILFGSLSVREGYVTQEEVDECIRAQDKERKPLGETMLTLGYISRLQLELLIKLQEQNLASMDLLTQQRMEDVLFGRLALREGVSTAEEVDACVKLQALWEREGRVVRLGQLMCERGYLSPGQVGRILELQKKRLMICSSCQLQYNVGDFEPGKQFACPRCGMFLAVAEDPADAGAGGAARQPAAGTTAPVPAAPPHVEGSEWGGIGPKFAGVPASAFDHLSSIPQPQMPFAWAAPS